MVAWSIAVVMAVMRVHVTGANFNNGPRQEFFAFAPVVHEYSNYRGNSFMKEPMAFDLCTGSHMKTVATRLGKKICSSDVNMPRGCCHETSSVQKKKFS